MTSAIKLSATAARRPGAVGVAVLDRCGLVFVERQHLGHDGWVTQQECTWNQTLRGTDRRVQSRPGVLVVNGMPILAHGSLESARFFAAAQRAQDAVELSQDAWGRVGRGARRGDAVQNAVQLVVLADGVFVEPLDECPAVITRGQQAVVLELDDGLLHRNATHPKAGSDLVAVDAVTCAQLAGQHQVKDVRNDLVFLFDAVLLRHVLLSPRSANSRWQFLTPSRRAVAV